MCTKVKLPCQYCNQQVERGELQQHMLITCPNATVECPQLDFGCTWNGTRSALDLHKRDCVFCKLSPVLQTIQKLKQQDEEQKAQINKLTSQCQQFAHEKQVLEKNVEQLQESLCREQNHRMYMDKLLLSTSQKQRELEFLKNLQRNIGKTQSAAVSITFSNYHYNAKEFEKSDPLELFGLKWIVRVYPSNSNAAPEMDCVMDVLLANEQYLQAKIVSLFTVQLTSTRLNLHKENVLVSSETPVRFCEAHSLREFMKINTMMIVQLNVTVTNETLQACQLLATVNDARDYEKQIREKLLSNNKSCILS